MLSRFVRGVRTLRLNSAAKITEVLDLGLLPMTTANTDGPRAKPKVEQAAVGESFYTVDREYWSRQTRSGR